VQIYISYIRQGKDDYLIFAVGSGTFTVPVWSLPMKVLILLFTLLFPALFQVQDSYEQIARNIREIKTNELAAHFDNTVEIIIDGREGWYLKQQAEVIVKNFLLKNRPKSFQIVHKGVPSDGLTYSIGHLITEDNKEYATYLLLKNKSGKMLIQQLKFEIQ
jgi:hypothetical protein